MSSRELLFHRFNHVIWTRLPYSQRVLQTLSYQPIWKWLLVGALFALCITPTLISYQPYLFGWDDGSYLTQSIQVSRAFWSGNIHGLGAMAGIRPPVMALLGIPWGRLASWDAAGKCFISLASLTALLVAISLYLMLQIGVKPFALITAAICVLASIGPYPHATSWMDLNPRVMAPAAHYAATGFFADCLLAWTAVASVLLIPYEAQTRPYLSTRAAGLHGVLWGGLLSLGVMTKLNFLYFIMLILPILVLIRLYQGGLRHALAAFAGFLTCAAPSAGYLARWGGPAFANLKDSSFGGVAHYYYIPVVQFVVSCIRESPGLLLSCLLTIAGLMYVIITNRTLLWSPKFLALTIMVVFGTIVLAATNKQIRYAFPAIVALPFLTALLISGKGDSVPRHSALLLSGLVFCGLVALGLPMRNRAPRQSIIPSEAVLKGAAACKAQNIMLATDSPTLSGQLMQLAKEILGSDVSINVEAMAFEAINGAPIEGDFQKISKVDQIVFQDKDKLSPPFTNVRVSAYEQYVRRLGYAPVKVADDISVYSMRCWPR